MHDGIEHVREQEEEARQKQRRKESIDQALRLSEARGGDDGVDEDDEAIVDYAETFYEFMEGDDDE